MRVHKHSRHLLVPLEACFRGLRIAHVGAGAHSRNWKDLAAFAFARHALATALHFVAVADQWADAIFLPGNHFERRQYRFRR